MSSSQAMPTATAEEFSFPTATDLYPYGIDSPPLWRLSPAESPDVFLDRKGKDQQDCFPDRPDEEHQEIRKSFSYKEKDSKLSDRIVADDEEEKMDMLWEDFNEELPRSRSSRSSEDMVEFGCGRQSLKLSKNNGAVFSPSPRRAGMLVFMRVLRKLFLLHNSQGHGSVKHRTWQTP